MIRYQQTTVDGNKIFYREAGPATAPTILLLHGFPTSSHMYRNLIPALADRYHVVAPDLPGFGFSDAPDRKRFPYTFENLAKVIDNFTPGHRPRALRNLHFRLRRAGRTAVGTGTSGADHRHHLAERQRL